MKKKPEPEIAWLIGWMKRISEDEKLEGSPQRTSENKEK
jgi:hypothetical protein